jgi:EamA domain-containing membrane protein RarD
VAYLTPTLGSAVAVAANGDKLNSVSFYVFIFISFIFYIYDRHCLITLHHF